MENNLSIVKETHKELPNNIEAEQSVIGSILVTNEIFDEQTITKSSLVADHGSQIEEIVSSPKLDDDLPIISSEAAAQIPLPSSKTLAPTSHPWWLAS